MLLKSGFSDNPTAKISLERLLKSHWFKRYTQQLLTLKHQHASQLKRLKLSFSTQIEDLHETVANLSQTIHALIDEKHYHGVKFIEIIEKSKEKIQQLKNENKFLKNNLASVSKEAREYKSEGIRLK